MPERLPDLGLGIEGVELQPEEERNMGDQREKKRRAVYEPVCRQP